MIDVYKGIAECDVNHIPIQYSAIFTGQSSVTSGNTAQGMVRAGCRVPGRSRLTAKSQGDH